jgi:membrane protein required for colicin V production
MVAHLIFSYSIHRCSSFDTVACNLIQAAINIVMLGWLNKLGGIVLYMLIYLFVYSILLFYLTKMGLLR